MYPHFHFLCKVVDRYVDLYPFGHTAGCRGQRCYEWRPGSAAAREAGGLFGGSPRWRYTLKWRMTGGTPYFGNLHVILWYMHSLRMYSLFTVYGQLVRSSVCFWLNYNGLPAIMVWIRNHRPLKAAVNMSEVIDVNYVIYSEWCWMYWVWNAKSLFILRISCWGFQWFQWEIHMAQESCRERW